MDVSDLTSLIEYGHRATRRRLTEIPNLEAAKRAREILAHLLATEKVWLARIHGEDPGIAIWPDLSLDECEALLAANESAFDDYFASLSATGLDEIISYRNSAGLSFRNTVREILLHLLLHGAHHRGQLAMLVRELDGVPENMGYITLARAARSVEPE